MLLEYEGKHLIYQRYLLGTVEGEGAAQIQSLNVSNILSGK